MQKCPVCKDGAMFTNQGVKIHIGYMSRTDEAHRIYRERVRPQTLIEVELKPETDRISVPVAYEARREYIKLELKKLKSEYELGILSEGQFQARKSELKEKAFELLKEADEKNIPFEPLFKQPVSSNGESASQVRVRKLKSSNPIGRSVGKLGRLFKRKPRNKKTKGDLEEIAEAKMKDPEGALDIITRIPAVILLFILMYKAWTDYRFFTGWMDTEIGQLYIYVFTNINDPASIIILVLTIITVAIVALVLHRVIWRLLFKDLQISYIKNDPKTGELKAIGTSKEGRIFLTLGRGPLDRLYRRITKTPKPDKVTLYFKRRGFVNPFKVLPSCEKGYIQDPDGTRFVIDGLFRRTLIATHLRRDTENCSTVYWFEDESYEHLKFDPHWYQQTHLDEIEDGLTKVSRACGMDSSIQKDQMRNVISWLPSGEVSEHIRVWEMMKDKMAPKQVQR